jgi:hypothetical protein
MPEAKVVFNVILLGFPFQIYFLSNNHFIVQISCNYDISFLGSWLTHTTIAEELCGCK